MVGHYNRFDTPNSEYLPENEPLINFAYRFMWFRLSSMLYDVLTDNIYLGSNCIREMILAILYEFLTSIKIIIDLVVNNKIFHDQSQRE